MARPLWLVEMIKKGFSRRFGLARLTNVQPIGRIADRMLFEGDDIIFLPQDKIIRVNKPLEIEQTVLPSQVVEHFIRQAGYHWIMNNCICREASHCRDYPVSLGCLFLGEAGLGINPALGRRVSMDEALEHVRRCREAGLVHLIGRNKLDLVWLGVSPGEKLLTICNCCPCCCLWRILPDVAPFISAKVHRMPGVRVQVSDKCIGCGVCTEEVCFVKAIDLADGRAKISDACRGCGRCVQICPEQAIQMIIEDRSFVQSTIDRLSLLVDIS